MKAFFAFIASMLLFSSCSSIIPFAEQGGKVLVKDVVEAVEEESVEYVVRLEITKLLIAILAIGVCGSFLYYIGGRADRFCVWRICKSR